MSTPSRRSRARRPASTERPQRLGLIVAGLLLFSAGAVLGPALLRRPEVVAPAKPAPSVTAGAVKEDLPVIVAGPLREPERPKPPAARPAPRPAPARPAAKNELLPVESTAPVRPAPVQAAPTVEAQPVQPAAPAAATSRPEPQPAPAPEPSAPPLQVAAPAIAPASPVAPLTAGPIPVSSLWVDSIFPGYSAFRLTDGRWGPIGRWSEAAWASQETGSAHWAELRFRSAARPSEVHVQWAWDRGRYHPSSRLEVQAWLGGRWATVGAVSPGPDEASSTVSLSPAPNTTRLRLYQPPGAGNLRRPNLMWVAEASVLGGR